MSRRKRSFITDHMERFNKVNNFNQFKRHRRQKKWKVIYISIAVVSVIAFLLTIPVPEPENPGAESTAAPDIPFTPPVEYDMSDAAEYDATDAADGGEASSSARVYSYDGPLELPVNGATGYAAVKTTVRPAPDLFSGMTAALDAGQGFMILQEQGLWWEIAFEDKTGWVRHRHCMINLPDVIPSIIYDGINTYGAHFVSSGVSIPNVTGEALYEGKAYNARLGREEFIFAVLYETAKKLYQAQQNALSGGDTIVLYEAFRPLSVQRRVAGELRTLSSANPSVNRGINTGQWSLTWFISTGVSNHQRGYAVDAGLAKAAAFEAAVTGDYHYTRISSYSLYVMPSPIHELSAASVTYTAPVDNNSLTAWQNATLSPAMRENAPARQLQKYFTDAGFTPLASEWWHFNDLHARSQIPESSNGDYLITAVYSVPPKGDYHEE